MYGRMLTIQDVSCVGQCSATVALPVISACGIECAMLPSAVLSNHTGGFSAWTFRDLTEAAFLLGRKPVLEGYDKAFIEEMAAGLHALGAKNVVLTGVSLT